MPLGESQASYREGFRFAALAVVLIILSGSFVAIFQKMPTPMERKKGPEAVPQATGGDG